jgi:hypothetical protein
VFVANRSNPVFRRIIALAVTLLFSYLEMALPPLAVPMEVLKNFLLGAAQLRPPALIE